MAIHAGARFLFPGGIGCQAARLKQDRVIASESGPTQMSTPQMWASIWIAKVDSRLRGNDRLSLARLDSG
jgi:hypothetical protein